MCRQNKVKLLVIFRRNTLNMVVYLMCRSVLYVFVGIEKLSYMSDNYNLNTYCQLLQWSYCCCCLRLWYLRFIWHCLTLFSGFKNECNVLLVKSVLGKKWNIIRILILFVFSLYKLTVLVTQSRCPRAQKWHIASNDPLIKSISVLNVQFEMSM